jgi:hypothetical protein
MLCTLPAQPAQALLPPWLSHSGEDSGELAALAAVQQRRKLMHAGPGGGGTQDQRYGQFWQGDDGELEDALHVSLTARCRHRGTAIWLRN